MSLESLPAELRLLILQHLDLPSLLLLIQTSSVYYRSYRFAKKSLLHQIVTQCYGAVELGEPLAALASHGLYGEWRENKHAIIALFDRRRRYRELPQPTLSQDDSLSLLHLYQKLAPLVDAMTSSSSSSSSSSTERARILRGLCRLQTYCNVFGAREWAAPPPPPSPSDPTNSQNLTLRRRPSLTWYRHFTIHEVRRFFFATMPPWEVDEFSSTATLLRERYADIFAAIERDYPRDSAEWKSLRPIEKPLSASEVWSPDAETSYTSYLDHFVSLGPCFLTNVLSQPSEGARRALLAANAEDSKSSPLDIVRLTARHTDTPAEPLLYPADVYDSPHLAELLPTLPAIEQPSGSWKRTWYGDAPIHRVRPMAYTEGLTSTGYAFWD